MTEDRQCLLDNVRVRMSEVVDLRICQLKEMENSALCQLKRDGENDRNTKE